MIDRDRGHSRNRAEKARYRYEHPDDHQRRRVEERGDEAEWERRYYCRTAAKRQDGFRSERARD
ncbi:MAG: hypothetical protein H7099_04880 [Gemmatimonadaceae bacterium]|nr:hypothetical protein [Gemmatimonadaceae bacterium]